MEIGQRLVLGEDHRVDAAVVVEVAGGQAAADALDLPAAPGLVGDIDQPAVGPVFVEPAGHGVRIKRPVVVDMAVGDHDVEPAVDW